MILFSIVKFLTSNKYKKGQFNFLFDQKTTILGLSVPRNRRSLVHYITFPPIPPVLNKAINLSMKKIYIYKILLPQEHVSLL